MAEKKKPLTDDVGTVESTVAAELTENDDLVEYIQPSSLDILRARYGEAEEDESIRSEGFELAKKSGLVRRQKPEDAPYGYYGVPTARDEIRTDVDSPLSQVFDTTRSDFDSDTVSFSDIDVEPVATTEDEESSIPTEVVTQPVSQEVIKATGNRYGFDTHTTVIYYDESADDGIRRNTEDELNSAFTPDGAKKRRRFPWLQKRK